MDRNFDADRPDQLWVVDLTYIRTWLYETPAADPQVFAVSASVLFFVALMASVVPARRAAAVEPLLALKAE